MELDLASKSGQPPLIPKPFYLEITVKVVAYLSFLLIMLVACDTKETKIVYPMEPNRYSIPYPPSELSITFIDSTHSAFLHWRDNSDNEDGFALQLRYDGYKYGGRYRSRSDAVTVPENSTTNAGFKSLSGLDVNDIGENFDSIQYVADVTAFNRGGYSPTVNLEVWLYHP
jgi:hypothetical protein